MLEKFYLFLVFYLPFQIALNPSPSVDLASIRLLLVIIFCFWLIKSLLEKKLFLPFGRTAFFVYLFVFLSIFSVFFAENAYWSFRKVAFILSIFPAYFIFSDFFEKKVFLDKTLVCIVWGSFLSALVGLLQFFSQFLFGLQAVYAFWGKNIAPIFLGNAFSESVLSNPSWLVNISGATVFRAVSFFPDPHMFAFYMGMTAPLAIFLFFTKKRKVFFVMFIAIVLADLLSFSRGGYLGLLAGLGFFYLGAALDSRLAFKKYLWPSFLTLGAFFLVFLATPVGSRFFDSFDLTEGSNLERLAIWKKTLLVSAENPLGVGIGNLPIELKPSASYRDPFYAHNLYLDIASETGIITLIAFLSILLTSLKSFVKKSKKDILYMGPAISLVVFFFHSLVETPLYSVHILTLFFIILAASSNKE